mmetsp:Transcript_10839/g.34428  ORF Transcript_10839/g.34428 Transcript_10839/m.34428 type:complete len:239 (-) Transcript_10839:976-1692(-)
MVCGGPARTGRARTSSSSLSPSPGAAVPILGVLAIRARRSSDSPGSAMTGGAGKRGAAASPPSPAPGSDGIGGAGKRGGDVDLTVLAPGSDGMSGQGKRGGDLAWPPAPGSVGNKGFRLARRDDLAAAKAAKFCTASSPGSFSGITGGCRAFDRREDFAVARPADTLFADGPRGSPAECVVALDRFVDEAPRDKPCERCGLSGGDDAVLASPACAAALASSAAASLAYLSRSSARSSR